MKNVNLAGKIAGYFIDSQLTILTMAFALLAGVVALLVTPREENPQIVVPAANVFVKYPGANALEVEEHISKPLEALLWELPGVEEVHSVSADSLSIVFVRFYVGESKEDSLIRLYDKIMSNLDIKPETASQPIIKPVDVDDVPIVAVTLSSKTKGEGELRAIADDVLDYLRRIPGTANPHIKGGAKRQVNVTFDPEKLAQYGLSSVQIASAIQMSNSNLPVGDFAQAGLLNYVETGDFLRTAEDVAQVVVASNKSHLVFLGDIATIKDSYEEINSATTIGFGPASLEKDKSARPAVTVAIAKKQGLNAVTIAGKIVQKVDKLKANGVIPKGVAVHITRNDGEKADHAVNELILHLAISIVVVVALLFFSLGFREAMIVAIAIPLTLFITLGVGALAGQTINRITLFALILSLGLLVDDAIVVVENIYRHYKAGAKDRITAAILAVHEIGSPTVLATLTVIVAFVPLAFVTGMMGPYMAPIPFNVPVAMLVSLVVAFVVTPWASLRLIKVHDEKDDVPLEERPVYKRYRAIVYPLLASGKKRTRFLLVVVAVFAVTAAFPAMQIVNFRMLPKADANTFLVTIDLPNGTIYEKTNELAVKIGKFLATVPEVNDYETFVGISSVIDFNGLLRGGSFRNQEHLADVRVNLVDKSKRTRKSEDIVLAIRAKLYKIGAPYNANIKLVEDPPGPPVRSTLVAEIYGPDYKKQRELASDVEKIFAGTDRVTDIDSSVKQEINKYYLRVDKEKATYLGISTSDIVRELNMGVNGAVVSTMHVTDTKTPVGIFLRYPENYRSKPGDLSRMYIRSPSGSVVPLSELVEIIPGNVERPIYHKNLEPVVYVFGEMEDRGSIYAVIDMIMYLWENPLPDGYRIVWDGEWDLTWDVMRDLGTAMVVAVVLIYLILVGRFRSFMIPLVIMGAIPLSVIGIMPGFALIGAYLSATSMIGIIALSGIVVRNSIVLLEFILDKKNEGASIEDAIIEAGAIRFRPIMLTAAAAILGAAVIANDPVWSGLAWSLIFGMSASTALTLVVIPVLFFMSERKHWKTPSTV
ncbi:Acriflavin resistance protein [hydrothermal vent metagenome]|uniref:Acriflavin resistance protein n=1 Tax=hydrothermal vent metagenome TaxID=652676 RepID=A0A3B1BYB4_9ZZZZ